MRSSKQDKSFTQFLANTMRPPGGDTSEPRTSVEPEQPQLQVLRLHDRNPLVKYDGRIYVCTWASTVGTDILLFKPDGPQYEAVPYLPISAGLGLGVTSALLAAKPAHVSPRLEDPLSTSKETWAETLVPRPRTSTSGASSKDEQDTFLKTLASIDASRSNTEQMVLNRSADVRRDFDSLSGDNEATMNTNTDELSARASVVDEDATRHEF